MEKNYNKPLFVFIKSDEKNATFFAASGTPGATGTFSIVGQSYSKSSW